MGLDMYAMITNNTPESPVDFKAENATDLHYWRIKAIELPDTEGFFFGKSDGTEQADDLTFIAKAREAIAQGQTVFYDSWW